MCKSCVHVFVGCFKFGVVAVEMYAFLEIPIKAMHYEESLEHIKI